MKMNGYIFKLLNNSWISNKIESNEIDVLGTMHLSKNSCVILFAFINIIPKIQSEIPAIDDTKVPAIGCIKKIILATASCGTVLTLMEMDSEFIASISKTNCYSISVADINVLERGIVNKYYVMTSTGIPKYVVDLEVLGRGVFWDPSAKFILYLNHVIDEEILEKYFKILLKAHIINAAVIGKVDTTYNIYTYHPYAESRCGHSFDLITKVGSCKTISNDIDNIQKNLYFHKFPRDYENCTLRVGITEDIPNIVYETRNFKTVNDEYLEGIEQFILRTVSDKYKFSVNYVHLDKQDVSVTQITENTTATGIFESLLNGTIDMAAGGYFLTIHRNRLFSYIWEFNFGSFRVITKTIEEPKWKSAYLEFEAINWILIACTFCCFCVIVKIVHAKCFRKNIETEWLILTLWGYFFFNINKKLSKEKDLRVLLASWLFFTFMISNFYSSIFYSFIAGNVRNPVALTPRILEEMGHKPCISNLSRAYFITAYNLTFGEDGDPQGCQELDDLFLTLANKPNLYSIEVDYSFRLRECTYLNPDGSPKLGFVDEHNGRLENLVMYTSKGIPIRNIFARVVHRMFETGLLMERLNSISLQAALKCPEKDKDIKSFRLIDVRIPFIILACGYILSTVVLCVEIILARK